MLTEQDLADRIAQALGRNSEGLRVEELIDYGGSPQYSTYAQNPDYIDDMGYECYGERVLVYLSQFAVIPIKDKFLAFAWGYHKPTNTLYWSRNDVYTTYWHRPKFTADVSTTE